MTIVRHFALNIVRAADDKRSIKLRRDKAATNNDCMPAIIGSVR
jgi:hypothetical protein